MAACRSYQEKLQSDANTEQLGYVEVPQPIQPDVTPTSEPPSPSESAGPSDSGTTSSSSYGRGGMADEEGSTDSGRVERLISWAASVVAPLSVLTAVLFYFGNVSSRAQFEYFGVDVDTIGLSTQDYVMRSPQALLTPLLVLVLVGVVVAIGT